MQPKIGSVDGPQAVRPAAAGSPVAPVATPAQRGDQRPIPGLDTFDRLDLKAGAAVLQAYAKFTVHPDSGIVTIKIIDSTTNEVIREIPPEEVVKIAEELQSYLDAHKRTRAGGAP